MLDERRKNAELRVIVNFIAHQASLAHKTSWQCIHENYTTMNSILHDSRDLSVSDDLLGTFETNKKIIEDIYNPKKKKPLSLSSPLTAYFTKILSFKDKITRKQQASLAGESPEIIKNKLEEFLRDYVIRLIDEDRVVYLMMLSVMYRSLHAHSTLEAITKIQEFVHALEENEMKPERSLTILIYNFCQASVDAMDATDLSKGSLLCERAVEMFKLIPKDSKVKEAIRSQIEDAIRITTERLVNRLQEKDQEEEVRFIEDIVKRLVNVDIIAYIMPQLVFFLIRAQKYDECLGYLDRILEAPISGEFMDFQTALTIGHYWCDSLLKAERYSRGQVDFSFIEKEKDKISKVFDISLKVVIPPIEDETFYNFEIEKLSVTFSHLGTLFFLTGDILKSAEAYSRSFDTILMKRCMRNRDSVDEIMDRYKDTLFHPLNSAPPEAHPLIAVYATEKGYDFLLDSQIKKFEREGIPFELNKQNFETIENPQKEMVSDLLSSVQSKIKHNFSSKYAGFKPFIEQKLTAVKSKMQGDVGIGPTKTVDKA